MPPKKKQTTLPFSKTIETLDVPSYDSSQPLTESYTYRSSLPTSAGPYILGVDEAGRGPVLGPMVYGVAFCPAAYKEDLEELGFDDSKQLTPAIRSSLLSTLCSDPSNLGWSVRVIAPQAISAGMLKALPINLNKQAQDATILLIREVIESGIELSEVYVDALGPTKTWQHQLSSTFPGISFTVTAKADSKFKIVGAASVAAKVTRDACIEGWVFEEDRPSSLQTSSTYFSSNGKQKEECKWSTDLGSGYPSDPKTKAWLQSSLDKTFGYPGIVRFSWATVKIILEKDAHAVEWIDEGQTALVNAFQTMKGRDKDRCLVAKDLGLKSVGML